MRTSWSVRNFASTEIVVVDAEPGAFWFGSWQNINVTVWLRAGQLDMVKRVDRAIGVRYDKLKTAMSTIHVVVAGVPPPEPDARTALVEMSEHWGHTVACAAVVIERGGFVGIALRSAITGIIILAPKHYRVKVFDTNEACAPWVADQNNRTATMQVQPPAVLEMLRYARKAAK